MRKIFSATARVKLLNTHLFPAHRAENYAERDLSSPSAEIRSAGFSAEQDDGRGCGKPLPQQPGQNY